jgi:hypothetical protein
MASSTPIVASVRSLVPGTPGSSTFVYILPDIFASPQLSKWYPSLTLSEPNNGTNGFFQQFQGNLEIIGSIAQGVYQRKISFKGNIRNLNGESGMILLPDDYMLLVPGIKHILTIQIPSSNWTTMSYTQPVNAGYVEVYGV